MNLRRRPRPRRKTPENIVPMINVVFLLLIFFLMAAEIAPPEPFGVVLPRAGGGTDPASETTLHIDANGLTGFRGLTGAPAMELLFELRDKRDPLRIRADAHLEMARLAGLLGELARAGFTRVEIMAGG